MLFTLAKLFLPVWSQHHRNGGFLKDMGPMILLHIYLKNINDHRDDEKLFLSI